MASNVHVLGILYIKDGIFLKYGRMKEGMRRFSMAGREYGSVFSGRAGMWEPFQWSGGNAGAFSMVGAGIWEPFQWSGGNAGAFSVVGQECGSLFSGRAGIWTPFQ